MLEADLNVDEGAISDFQRVAITNYSNYRLQYFFNIIKNIHICNTYVNGKHYVNFLF